ncbi:uncharacterized protein F4807DRAFT_447528 [Annulohypoxylon truncatum]|uniref:uncharacterized protein n=1 Tax=Annulohypoxylon truncatum TaxID=327061 RepID=UPI0020078C0B|nr:uncharacterized protein F4807DRAFT_447528 [Annulohypoxylon truncatum]KAI1204384.1 hypothetical protein F4807DRAFT_447528 [Annulohypoxylon truncatum]
MDHILAVIEESTSETSATASPASTTTTPSISVLTLTIKPLTTTFTPPSSCGEMHLTQLSSPGYQLWLNEPQPVPGSKFGDCYPPGFIEGYTSISNASSSVAPLFSPLVCPEGWTTAMTWTNGYIACCASGFLLHPPDTTVDPNRPGYGGTCYSDFQVGQTVEVTAYNSASVTATAEWIASATNDQAYAHPIDGFQVVSDDNTPSRLSGGAIAGIVVGSVAGLILILLALLFLFQRYRRKRAQQSSGDHYQSQPQGIQQEIQQEQLSKELAASPSTGYLQSPYDSTGGTLREASPPLYATNQRYELGVPESHELDSGFLGRELEARQIPKHEVDRSGW